MDNEDYLDGNTSSLNLLMSNKTYNALKFLTQIVFPAVAVFYLTLAPLWGLPKQEEVAGTLMAVVVLLGAILGLSSRKYQNATEGPVVGFIDVTNTESGKNLMLNFPGDPDDIDKHEKITFKVNKPNKQ